MCICIKLGLLDLELAIFFYVIRILKSWKFWKTFIFGIHFEQEITSGLVMLFCVMGMCTCVLVLIILYV